MFSDAYNGFDDIVADDVLLGILVADIRDAARGCSREDAERVERCMSKLVSEAEFAMVLGEIEPYDAACYALDMLDELEDSSFWSGK